MKLHFKKLGQGKPLIILHGILGMLDNWMGIGKILAQNFEVFLVDARNHGHSLHSDVFNYEAMADDILELMVDNSLESAVIMGHSMGGKTAMNFSSRFPERIEKLIVVDIAPKAYSPQHDNIFDALLAVDFSKTKSRKEVESVLSAFITENHILQLLLKNLYWKEADKLGWRFNLNGIFINTENAHDFSELKVFSKPTLFLRGEKSDYISEGDFGMIKKLFPSSEIITIPKAGHWIHAEQPELFVKAVKEFLK